MTTLTPQTTSIQPIVTNDILPESLVQELLTNLSQIIQLPSGITQSQLIQIGVTFHPDGTARLMTQYNVS